MMEKSNKKWSLKEIEYLKQNHKIKTYKEMSQELKRSVIALYVRKYKLGLKNVKRSKFNIGNKNPMWKGDRVGYSGLHFWIIRHKPKPELCVCCNKRPAYEVANISGEYKRDINDYEWLCRGCHMKKDGRINNLKSFQKK